MPVRLERQQRLPRGTAVAAAATGSAARASPQQRLGRLPVTAAAEAASGNTLAMTSTPIRR
jgi:hypothetical protein